MDELLLDTTYLLPSFGVALRLDGFQERFPLMLENMNVHYNPISLVEAKWVILRLVREQVADHKKWLDAYKQGLGVLLSNDRLVETELTSEEIESVADGLFLQHSVKDYFDRIIYATACSTNRVLVTEDEKLHSFKERTDLPRPKNILSWKDLGEADNPAA